MMEETNIITREEIHLRDYFIVLDRYKWLVAAVTLVVLLLTVLYLKRQVPVYQAQTKMIIESRWIPEVFSSESASFRTDWVDLETQVVAIKTTPVLASVVKELGITTASEGSPGFVETVNRLKKSVEVRLIKNTKMATITTTHPIPEMARDMANSTAQAYIVQDRLSKLQAGRDAVKWLGAQLADLKIKLKDSEEAFQEFKEREKIITLDDRRSEESEEIARLNASYATARVNRLEVETIINKLDENDADANIPIALLNNPALQTLGAELSQFQAALAGKKKLFKDAYPAVIELKDRIQLTEKKILAELKRQRNFLQAQELLFLDQQKSKRSEALKLGRKQLEYLTLEREVATNREIYNMLLAKVKEVSLIGESGLNSIRIVEPAELPSMPVGGNRTTIILGGILGLLLGTGLAFFLKYLENTIRTPDDVKQHLALPVLGIVPQFGEANNGKTLPLLLEGDPKSSSAEAYRSLRTNILFSVAEAPPRIIVITSAEAREGKSVTVANLGMALAESGYKVLLVDADLRRPTLHQAFHVDRDKGLSTVLAEDLAIDEVIAETDVPNLSILTAGSEQANPSESLGSTRMKKLIEQIREQYDVALFDSSPMLGMTDTTVLALESDAVVIVIKIGKVRRKTLKIALAQLEHVGAKVRGIVLNNVDLKRDRDYYYYSYSPYEDDGKIEPENVKKEKRSSRQTRIAGSRPDIDGKGWRISCYRKLTRLM